MTQIHDDEIVSRCKSVLKCHIQGVYSTFKEASRGLDANFVRVGLLNADGATHKYYWVAL